MKSSIPLGMVALFGKAQHSAQEFTTEEFHFIGSY